MCAKRCYAHVHSYSAKGPLALNTTHIKTHALLQILRDAMKDDERQKLIKELTLSRQFDSPYTVQYHGINVSDGQIQLFVERMRSGP